MKSLRTRSSGFAHIILLLIIVAVIIGGYFAIKSNNGNFDPRSLFAAVGSNTSAVTGPISVSLVSSTATLTSGLATKTADTGKYTIQFKLSAGAKDIWVSRYMVASQNPTSVAGGVAYYVTPTSSAGASTFTSRSLTASNTNQGDSDSSFVIPANTSRTFTLTIAAKAKAQGYTGVKITGINYSETSTIGSTYYKSVDTLKTSDLFMQSVPTDPGLSNITPLTDITRNVNTGDSATPVIGVAATALGADQTIQRVDATFVIGGTHQSDVLSAYASDVSLYLDGVKLGSLNPASGDKNGLIWTYRFSGLNGLIKAGNTGRLYVKITPIAKINRNDDGQKIVAELLPDSIRAVGPDGISSTYVTGTVQQLFTVSTPSGGTLKVSAGPQNPAATLIQVSSSTTAGVRLLNFDLKVSNQQVTIHDLKAQFCTSDNSIADVISTVKLTDGGTPVVISAKTVNAGSRCGFVIFNNIDQSIVKDGNANFSIVADLKGDTAYADGTTLTASTTVTGWNVEDAVGNNVIPSSSVSGGVQTLSAVAIIVSLGSPSATVATAGYVGGLDVAVLSIPFSVTTGDRDVWIGGASTNQKIPSGPNKGVVFATTTISASGKTTMPRGSVTSADAYGASGLDANNNFYVASGVTRNFTLTVPVGAISSDTAGVANLVQIAISGINYSFTNAMGSMYYKTNVGTFTTPPVYVGKH